MTRWFKFLSWPFAVAGLALLIGAKCDVPVIVFPSPSPSVSPTPCPTPPATGCWISPDGCTFQPCPSPSPTAEPTPVPTPQPTPTPGCVAATAPDDNWDKLTAVVPYDGKLWEDLNGKMRELALAGIGKPPTYDEKCFVMDGTCPAPPSFVERLAYEMRMLGYCTLARGDDTIGIGRGRCATWHADVITSEGYVLWQKNKQTDYWRINDGSCTEGPVVTPTPTPMPTPTIAPSPADPGAEACGLPAPPPAVRIDGAWLYGQPGGIIDTAVQVYGCDQEPNYCEVIGLGTLPSGGKRCHCPPRSEAQPEQRDACIELLTGGSVWEDSSGLGETWPDKEDGRPTNPWMYRYRGGRVRVCAKLHPDLCSPYFELSQ